MEKITFRQLLNLIYNNKAPKWIKHEYSDREYEYIGIDYVDCEGEYLSSDISRVLLLEQMAHEKCITISEEILTKTEKEYLSNIIKPFKKYISVIKKISIKSQEQIIIMYHDYLNTDGSSFILFPTFKQGTMYRGMELYKEYTLKELGL